jgi:hypothetical protein
MRDPRGLRGPTRTRSTPHRRRWIAVGALVVAALAFGGAAGLHLQVTHSTETVAGLQAPARFLNHWQQVGSETGVVGAPVPRLWSGVVGAPTRLSRFPTTYRIDAATSGDLALLWVFNETVGIPTSTEIEIEFQIHYLVGVTATVASIKVFVETQRGALAGTLSFTVDWDSGHAAGVTFVDQLQVTQACVAVGTCP